MNNVNISIHVLGRRFPSLPDGGQPVFNPAEEMHSTPHGAELAMATVR